MARIARLRGGVGVVLLLGSACAVLLPMPWQGPIILSHHGPRHPQEPRRAALFALAFGYVQRTDGWRAPSWPTGRWAVPASAILLGALLAVGGVGAKWISSSSEALLPAGGVCSTAAPYMPTRDGPSR